MRAPDDPTGGIARPPASREPALVAASPTGVTPADVTDEIGGPPKAISTLAVPPSPAPLEPPAESSEQFGDLAALVETTPPPPTPPESPAPTKARRGAGLPPPRRRGVIEAGHQAEPASPQERSQGPTQGGQGGGQATGPPRTRRRPRSPPRRCQRLATQAAPVGSLAPRTVPPRRLGRTRLPRLDVVPHSDARDPGRRRPPPGRGAGARRRLRMGDHRRRGSLRRVPHARSGHPHVAVGG